MGKNKYISFWLFGLCLCFVLILVLGGLTRLTDSGLSIVKWEPLTGVLPPIGVKWDYYFAEYQKTSQYQLMNHGMTLDEFKGIFWLEYFHRLIVRVMVTVLVLPFVYFLYRRKLDKKLVIKVLMAIALITCQAVVGWYMVKSGFKARTNVSQYMLAFHLGMGFLTFGVLFICGLDSVIPAKAGISLTNRKGIPAFAGMTVGLVFLMVLLGAFMAGTHAGYSYNTWPLMDGKIVPGGLYVMQPWWRNHFENVAMIQFQHRWVAIVTGLVIFWFAARLWKLGDKKLAVGFAGVVLLQISLGILTLYVFGNYTDYRPETYAYNKVFYTPVIIAALHQLNALVLFSVALFAGHKFSRKKLDIVV